MAGPIPPEQFLRVRDVEARTGIKKTFIYALMKEERFPAQILLGPRTAVWQASAVDRWIAEQVAKAQAGRAAGA